MVEILPIKVLTDEDSPIFGVLNVSLGKLDRVGLPVASGIAITPPNLHLNSILERFDFGSKEVFEQSLNLVKKEINATPVPEILIKETGKQKVFLLDGILIKNVRNLWLVLLNAWLEEIKGRLWKEGFYKGITEGLTPQAVFFIKNVESLGTAYYDILSDDSTINIRMGKVHPNDLRKIHDLVELANKKLFIPHEYEWIVDGAVKLVGLKPYTQPTVAVLSGIRESTFVEDQPKSTIKVFLDLSKGLTIEKEVDGIFIASEKIFDLNTPSNSFENLVFKLVESAITFPHSPILLKLADKSEGMGKVRGTLRLLHQKSLLEPIIEALDFVRHKKGLTNVHIVVPFVRGTNELLQIKRELAVKNLGRKHSLKLWMEAAIPENIVNLEHYLIAGIDGVVLNLDELAGYFGGFDHTEDELSFYSHEVDGLLKFLEDGLKIMHKSKTLFIAYGNLILNPKVLDFLIEKGAYGMVIERYEAPSAHGLLRQAEKRMILRKAS